MADHGRRSDPGDTGQGMPEPGDTGQGERRRRRELWLSLPGLARRKSLWSGRGCCGGCGDDQDVRSSRRQPATSLTGAQRRRDRAAVAPPSVDGSACPAAFSPRISQSGTGQAAGCAIRLLPPSCRAAPVAHCVHASRRPAEPPHSACMRGRASFRAGVPCARAVPSSSTAPRTGMKGAPTHPVRAATRQRLSKRCATRPRPSALALRRDGTDRGGT
jgi:hypothetical protein